MRSTFYTAACATLALVAFAGAAPRAHHPATHPKPKHAAAKHPAAKHAAWHPKYTNAPADEYFGRLKMSILGVRSKVKDLGLDVEVHPAHDNADLANALWVEDAMRDWARKYPFDHWLPRYAYALESMYEQIPGTEAHRRAIKQLGYITAYFPTTVYGKIGRMKLAMGVPTPDPSATPVVETELQRLAFLDGKVLPTPPPAPTPQPTPTPTPMETETPTPTPEPSASPSATRAP